MEQLLVSVIVRTCQRPEILRTALNSLRAQTYPNIEVVVIEDGPNTAQELLQEEFSDLNYVYESTGERKGRTGAGNRGLELASGRYINFLDDDDAFFPEHVAVLAEALAGEERLAAYTIAEEHQIKAPDKCRRKTIRYRQEFNRLLLYALNYIPIQSIMFRRELYETLGGFDENLDNLEDWDLWVRYSTMTDFKFVDKVTSYYNVPYDGISRKKRNEGLRSYVEPIYAKFETYSANINIAAANREMNYVIREYKNKGVMRYLRMFFRAILFGEK